MSTWKKSPNESQPKKSDDKPNSSSQKCPSVAKDKKSTEVSLTTCKCSCNCKFHIPNSNEVQNQAVPAVKLSIQNPCQEKVGGSKDLTDQQQCPHCIKDESKIFFKKWLRGISDDNDEPRANTSTAYKSQEKQPLPKRCSVQGYTENRSRDSSYNNPKLTCYSGNPNAESSRSDTALPSTRKIPDFESSYYNTKTFPQKKKNVASCNDTTLSSHKNPNFDYTYCNSATPGSFKNPINYSYNDATPTSHCRSPNISSTYDSVLPSHFHHRNPNIHATYYDNFPTHFKTANPNTLCQDYQSQSPSPPKNQNICSTNYNALPSSQVITNDALYLNTSTFPTQQNQNINVICNDSRPTACNQNKNADFLCNETRIASSSQNHPLKEKLACGCSLHGRQIRTQYSDSTDANVPSPSTIGRTAACCQTHAKSNIKGRNLTSLCYQSNIEASESTLSSKEDALTSMGGQYRNSPLSSQLKYYSPISNRVKLIKEKELFPCMEKGFKYVIEENGKDIKSYQHQFSPCCLERTTKECKTTDQKDLCPHIPMPDIKYGKILRQECDNQQSIIPSKSTRRVCPEGYRSTWESGYGYNDRENIRFPNRVEFVSCKENNLPDVTVKVYFQSKMQEYRGPQQRPPSCSQSRNLGATCCECYKSSKVENESRIQNVEPEVIKQSWHTTEVWKQPLHATEIIRQNIPPMQAPNQICIKGDTRKRPSITNLAKAEQKCSVLRLQSSTDLQIGKIPKKQDSKTISFYPYVNIQRSLSTGILNEDSCKCMRCKNFHALGHRIGTSSSETVELQNNIEWRTPPVQRNAGRIQSTGKRPSKSERITSKDQLQTEELAISIQQPSKSSKIDSRVSRCGGIDYIPSEICEFCNRFHNQGHKLRICSSESSEDTYEFSNLGWYAVERYRKKCPELDPNCEICKKFHNESHCDHYNEMRYASSDSSDN